jgi:hypothetical protein
VYGDARVSGDAWVSGKTKLTSILCSRFYFEFDWQVKLWQSYEKKYETEVKWRDNNGCKNSHKTGFECEKSNS